MILVRSELVDGVLEYTVYKDGVFMGVFKPSYLWPGLFCVTKLNNEMEYAETYEEAVKMFE